MLRVVVDWLKGAVVVDDMVVRIGGDEFVVLRFVVVLVGLVEVVVYVVWFVVIMDVLVDCVGVLVCIGFSVGVLLIEIEGFEVDWLLWVVDEVFYSVKCVGCGCVVVVG